MDTTGRITLVEGVINAVNVYDVLWEAKSKWVPEPIHHSWNRIDGLAFDVTDILNEMFFASVRTEGNLRDDFSEAEIIAACRAVPNTYHGVDIPTDELKRILEDDADEYDPGYMNVAECGIFDTDSVVENGDQTENYVRAKDAEKYYERMIADMEMAEAAAA